MLRLAPIAMVFAAVGLLFAAEQTRRGEHVVVTYGGCAEVYPAAMARTIETARALAAAEFGFDMPETVTLTVTCGSDQQTRLFTDGKDRFFLSVASEKDLRRPAESGIFHLYGMCHELGHLAMYRPLLRREWLSAGACEGWAHWLGSRLVDGVYACQGERLWPDAYDYRADGMARLTRQLAAASQDDTTAAAGLWMELAKIVGDKGIFPIFRAWGQLEVDLSNPAPVLQKALLAANNDPRLAAWWKKAEPVLVTKREKSAFAAKTVAPKDLRGKPADLVHDDGIAADKASMAGTGHAVRFEAPPGEWYLTSVAIYGAPYGAAAPGETFHVWLCDEDFRAVADFPLPCSAVPRGEAKWTPLRVTPTRVPAKFIVCVGFNPTATKGVFLSHDKEAGGNSLVGLPGEKPRPFTKGDWMIRVQVDQAKSARRPASARG
jgi:hypothetical protein